MTPTRPEPVEAPFEKLSPNGLYADEEHPQLTANQVAERAEITRTAARRYLLETVLPPLQEAAQALRPLL